MKRVLIVDDDVSIVEGLQMFFEIENIAATGAFDRESAESMMAAEYFPIVLADLRLRTEADGLQLLEAIRRISPRSRIASMTGALDFDEERLRELGASVVLRKPFGPDEIVAIVRELLAEIERVETALAADAATTPSLEEIYVAAQRVLHSIPMRRYGLTREDAEELVQETWCLFLEQRAAIRNPKPWLSGTIVNLCRRAIQDRYRDRDRAERQPPKSEAFEPKDDVRLIVQRGLEQLDDRARTLCELIGMEQWSYDEVSAHLGIPLGSVGPLYIRAKTKLRNAVASAN
jgi:RNA polymerase sigma factor (sigma-70 family)